MPGEHSGVLVPWACRRRGRQQSQQTSRSPAVSRKPPTGIGTVFQPLLLRNAASRLRLCHMLCSAPLSVPSRSSPRPGAVRRRPQAWGSPSVGCLHLHGTKKDPRRRIRFKAEAAAGQASEVDAAMRAMLAGAGHAPFTAKKCAQRKEMERKAASPACVFSCPRPRLEPRLWTWA